MIAAVLLMLSCLASRAAAGVRISGNAEQLVLEVENASLGEVLAALREALPIQVTVIGDTARTFTGTYSGSVERVLMRLVSHDDHDFFLAVRPGGLQLTLLDRKPGGSRPAMAAVSGVADANDPHIAALAATEHGSVSRAGRLRKQRLLGAVGSVDPN
jgi:hypothetical protein